LSNLFGDSLGLLSGFTIAGAINSRWIDEPMTILYVEIVVGHRDYLRNARPMPRSRVGFQGRPQPTPR
jgi:hypothetical protein